MNENLNTRFRKRLIVFYLYRQIANKEEMKAQVLSECNKYVKTYFKVIKKNQKKNTIYNNEHYSNYFKYLSKNKNQKINYNDELAFVFNIIDYFITFKMPRYALSDCSLVLDTVANDFKKGTEMKYLLDYNLLKILLCNPDSQADECFKLIKDCYTNISINPPFFSFLFYSLLNLYLIHKSTAITKVHTPGDILELIQLLSVEDLSAFINYSLREMKLVQSERYIEMLKQKQELNPPFPERFTYYSYASYLFQLKQMKIKIDSQSPRLVDMISEYIITKEPNSEQRVKDFMSQIDSKDNNCLILLKKPMKGANEYILNQIQIDYLTSQKLFELVTHFYNHLLIIDNDESIQYKCELIEHLLYFIARRNKAAEWQKQLELPSFHSILFNILNWYNDTIYNMKGNDSKYLKIIIMHKIYSKLMGCLVTFPSLFVPHKFHLLKKKGDSYYKIEKYNKARVIYIEISRNDPSDWRVIMKIVFCSLKMFDIKQAKHYLSIGKKQMSQMTEDKKYQKGIEAIDKYLRLNKDS